MKRFRRDAISFAILFLLLVVVCLPSAMAEISEKAAERIREVVQSVVTPGMSDYDKALALNNWIIDHVTYIMDDDTYYSPDRNILETALFQGKAVCAGYTELYGRLLDEAGIENDTEEGKDPEETYHIWNVICLDGQWYHVDCTWNDNSNRPNTYFCLPDGALEGVIYHDGLIKAHECTDWTKSYLYKYNCLDEKLNNIRSIIESKFAMGIGRFQFTPVPSLIYSPAAGMGSGAVERYIVMQIISTWEFQVGDTIVIPEIELEPVNNSLKVTAQLPELQVDMEFDSDPEHYVICEVYTANSDDAELRVEDYLGDSYKLRIPEGVQTVYMEAKDNIVEVELPDSVIYCDFANCKNLRRIRMSSNITNTYMSFMNCESLESIDLPEGLESIGYQSFQGCLSLQSVNIPSTVKEIANSAFRFCSSLSSPIVIPGGVEEIGYCAFQGDISLKSVEISEGVKRIDEHVFSDCAALETVVLPQSLESIGEWSFNECDALNNVTLPDRLTEIPNGLFYGCDSLTSIVIPANVKKIGISAFSSYFGGKTSHLESVTLPDELEEICTYAFANCCALKEIVMPESLTQINDAAFDYSPECVWVVKAGSYPYQQGKKLKQPLSVLCDAHILELQERLEPSCEEDGHVAYYMCTACEKIFSDAKGKTELTEEEYLLPMTGHEWNKPEYTWDLENNKVTAVCVCKNNPEHRMEEISPWVGSEVTKQPTCEEYGESVYTVQFDNPMFSTQSITAEDVQPIGHLWGLDPDYSWSEDHSSCTAYIVCLHDTSHRTGEETGAIRSVVKQHPSEGTGIITLIAEFDSYGPTEKTIYIPAISEMKSYLRIPEWITDIGQEAFAGCLFDAVLLGEGCKTIGERAFADCPNLIYIQVPASITSIAENAFEGCGFVIVDYQ